MSFQLSASPELTLMAVVNGLLCPPLLPCEVSDRLLRIDRNLIVFPDDQVECLSLA